MVTNWYCKKQVVDCTVRDSDDAFTDAVRDVEHAGLIGGRSASVGSRVENSPDNGFWATANAASDISAKSNFMILRPILLSRCLRLQNW